MAKKELGVNEKLRLLYDLQQIDSQIDEIKILKGELPMEVSDLEDEVAGLETRVTKIETACDDGNNDPGDGCSADCMTVETGYTCTKGAVIYAGVTWG